MQLPEPAWRQPAAADKARQQRKCTALFPPLFIPIRRSRLIEDLTTLVMDDDRRVAAEGHRRVSARCMFMNRKIRFSGGVCGVVVVVVVVVVAVVIGGVGVWVWVWSCDGYGLLVWWS